MTDYQNYQNETVVNLGSNKGAPSRAAIIVVLLLFLALVAAISFGLGWFLGQRNVNSTPKETNTVDTKAIKAPDGKDIYLDQDEGYQVTYAKTWTAESKSGEIKGVTLKKDSSTVDIYLADKKVDLSKEQKAKLEKTNKIELTVDGKKITATENVLKDGYITVGTVAATEKSPQVSFVLNATDEVAYPEAKEIVSSIHFL